MSAKQTGLVWELDLPHNEAWVLMAMADHADHDGHNVYPGVPLLAWKTGYTMRQVRRILNALEEKGLIVVEAEGGGRRTTRYRLELTCGERKEHHLRSDSRSGKVLKNAPKSREDKMSPLPLTATETPMSPLGGQNVRADRTQLCHPNRQGTEEIEPSIPPPSISAAYVVSALLNRASSNDENRERDTNSGEDDRGDDEVTQAPSSAFEPVWRAWAEWAGRGKLPPERRRAFDLQAERLALGADLKAWTHPSNGTVVPVEDRPRLLKLGLQYLQDSTSRTLRGGVMYAVAKHYRIPRAVAGTEQAAVIERGLAAEYPGQGRQATRSKAIVTVAAVLNPASIAASTADEDPVERWEREHPDESLRLRELITRQIASEATGRTISDQTLLLMGRAQYRQLALQRAHRQKMEGADPAPASPGELGS